MAETRPGGRISIIPKEHRGAHQSTMTQTPKPSLTDAQVERGLLAAFTPQAFEPASLVPVESPPLTPDHPIAPQRKTRTVQAGTHTFSGPHWEKGRMQKGDLEEAMEVVVLPDELQPKPPLDGMRPSFRVRPRLNKRGEERITLEQELAMSFFYDRRGLIDEGGEESTRQRRRREKQERELQHGKK